MSDHNATCGIKEPHIFPDGVTGYTACVRCGEPCFVHAWMPLPIERIRDDFPDWESDET